MFKYKGALTAPSLVNRIFLVRLTGNRGVADVVVATRGLLVVALLPCLGSRRRGDFDRADVVFAG